MKDEPTGAPRGRSPRRPRIRLAAVALIGAAPLVLLWRAVLQDRVLAPADMIFGTPFFAGAAPADWHRPANPLLFDQAYQFVPWRHFAWSSLRDGRLPLWNPHSLAGTPFVATMQSAVFYPINLALAAVPFPRTFVLSALLRLWIAGGLTYALARRTGRSPPASLVAALAFMLSGFMVVWLGHPHTNVAVWLPGLLLATELVVGAPNSAARLRAGAALAVLVGVQFLGGHAETSADILFAAAVYGAVRWWQVVPARAGPAAGRLAPAGVFLLALALGATMAAIQLLPFLEWLPLSDVARERSAAASYPLVRPGWWHELLLLPLFLFPNVYGNPTWEPPYFDFLPYGRNYNGDVLYVGVLSFLLAWVAIRRHAEPHVRAWLVLAVVAFGRAFHVPVFDWLNDLPVLRLGKANMLRLVLSFAVAMLAAHGADRLFGASAGPAIERRWRRLCAAVLVAGILLLLAGRYLLPRMRDRLLEADRARAARTWTLYGGEPRPLADFDPQARRMVAATLRAFHWRNAPMYASTAFAGLALLLALVRTRRGGAAAPWEAALPLLVAADLLLHGYGYNPTVATAHFYPRPPGLDAIAAERRLVRASAVRRDLVPDAHMMLGLSDIRGLDFPTRWYAEYASLAPEYSRWLAYGVTYTGFGSPLLRVLNLGYIFSAGDSAPARPPAVAAGPVLGQGRWWIVTDPQPRSFMVFAARAVADDEARALLRAVPDSVFSRVLLDDGSAAPPLAPASGEPRADVALDRYGAGDAAWRVRTDREGWLVTTDAYYPGWTAELDGRPAPIRRANLAFRAVRVPPGEHVVRYRFRPRSVGIGAALGVLGAAATLILLAASRRASGR